MLLFRRKVWLQTPEQVVVAVVVVVVVAEVVVVVVVVVVVAFSIGIKQSFNTITTPIQQRRLTALGRGY